MAAWDGGGPMSGRLGQRGDPPLGAGGGGGGAAIGSGAGAGRGAVIVAPHFGHGPVTPASRAGTFKLEPHPGHRKDIFSSDVACMKLN